MTALICPTFVFDRQENGGCIVGACCNNSKEAEHHNAEVRNKTGLDFSAEKCVVYLYCDSRSIKKIEAKLLDAGYSTDHLYL